MSTTALALPDDDIGLGDFDQSDAVVPRMKIIGPDAQFEDSLTKERFDDLDVVLLGLVKSRILWEAELGEGDHKPLCRSLDNITGTPSTDAKFPFPYKESGYAPADVEANGGHIDCASCPLKEWGSHPKRDKVPWCTQQLTLPAMTRVGETGWAPILLTFQGSGVKPLNAYLSYFKGRNVAPYTVVTNISLSAQKRGTVHYAVPVFAKGSDTEAGDWPVFAQNWRNIRTFLHTPRMTEGEAEPDEPASAASKPTPAAAAPAANVPDDEIPF